MSASFTGFVCLPLTGTAGKKPANRERDPKADVTASPHSHSQANPDPQDKEIKARHLYYSVSSSKAGKLGTQPSPGDMSQASRKQPKSVTDYTRAQGDRDNFNCSVCGQGFNVEDAMWTHMGTKHSDQLEVLRCISSCPFVTVDKSHLRHHISTCTHFHQYQQDIQRLQSQWQ